MYVRLAHWREPRVRQAATGVASGESPAPRSQLVLPAPVLCLGSPCVSGRENGHDFLSCLHLLFFGAEAFQGFAAVLVAAAGAGAVPPLELQSVCNEREGRLAGCMSSRQGLGVGVQ